MGRFLRQLARTIAIFLLCSAAVPVLVTITILGSFIFLPLPAALPEPKELEAGQISRVYDQNGQEIGQFREFEQNIPVNFADIPLHLKQAVIAAEDRNFYSHGGVDVRGSLRALSTDLRGREVSQGGSTITQQYVKNAYVGKERTIVRKVREAVLASQLDRQVEKDDILFKYLTTIYLGEGAYGVGAAAETYFRKPVSQLTLSESALLAGVIPAPSRYEPRGSPKLAEQKRRIVLDAMLGQGYITPEQHAEASAQVVWLAVSGPPPGPATLIHPNQQAFSKYPYYVDYVKRYLIAKYGDVVVNRGGLRIQTSLHPRMQAAADGAVAEALKGTRMGATAEGVPQPLEMAMAAVEPPTGFVKALVGGRDFNAPGGQVNLALGSCYKPTDPRIKPEVEATCWPLDEEEEYVKGGGTGRQSGSSWKPYVLAAALEKGVQPSKVYPAPGTYRIPNCKGPKGCTISNYEGGGGGSANLRQATVKSYNTVFAQLVRDVGCKEAGEMAKKLGITSAWYASGFHTCSGTYALGVVDVSPLEMASAYGVFAAGGLRQEPTPIVKVEDAKGNVLEDNRKRESNRVLDEVIADNVTDILRGVISGGTGTRAQINRPAAGKTGTTNDSKDSWFVGYTPTLSAAFWIGYRDQPQPMRGIKFCRVMTGGCLPAATWKTFMSDALKDVPATEFNEPAPIKIIGDKLDRAARTGIDPGPARKPAPTGSGGPYQVGPPPPTAAPPTTSTTQPSDGRPTTTTTAPATTIVPRP